MPPAADCRHQQDAVYLNQTYSPLVVVLPETLNLEPQIRRAGAVVLYREGSIHSKLLTKHGPQDITWKDDGTLIIIPGESTIRTTGDGTLVVYFQNYLLPDKK